LAVVEVVGLAAGAAVALLVRHSNETGEIKLPDFVYSASAPQGAATAYQFALSHPQILSQIPCHCGCGQEAGHKSNLDCFIKSRNGNDVKFDDHASY